METAKCTRRIWTAPVLLFSVLAALVAIGCWIEQAQAQTDQPPPPPPNHNDLQAELDCTAQPCHGDRARMRDGFDGPPPRWQGDRADGPQAREGRPGREGRGPDDRGGQGYARGGFDGPPPRWQGDRADGPQAREGRPGREGRGPDDRSGQGYARGGFDGPPPRWQGDRADGPQAREGRPERMGKGRFGDGPGYGPPDGPRGQRRPNPETVFGDMDANGDQAISKDEFLKFHEEHRPPFGPPPGAQAEDRPPRPDRPTE